MERKIGHGRLTDYNFNNNIFFTNLNTAKTVFSVFYIYKGTKKTYKIDLANTFVKESTKN